MKPLCKISSIIAFIACVSSYGSLAATSIVGSIKGDTVHWDDAKVERGYVLSQGYEPMGNLPYSKEWVAGIATIPTSVTVTNESGDSAIVSLSAAGGALHYSHASQSSANHSQNSTLCDAEQLSSSNYTVVSKAAQRCYGSKKVILTEAKQPFNYIQPMVKFTNLIADFKSKPAGIYTGTMTVLYSYGFKNGAGAFTYRDIPVTQNIIISHMPAFIDSVDVNNSTLVLDPEIDASGNLYSNNDVKVTVNGVMGESLQLYVPDRSYELIDSASKAQPIPLDIVCTSGCNNTSLVSDGSVTNKSINIDTSSSRGNSSYDFNLEFSYLINNSSIEEGTFRNDFYFIVELPVQ